MDDLTETIKGVAALAEALDVIGGSNKTDHDLARIIVDEEMPLRALVAFTLRAVAKKASQRERAFVRKRESP